MDKIQKVLKKFSTKEKDLIRLILSRLKSGNLQGLNIQKLKGYKDIFRVRKGNIRIIYRWLEERLIILAIERRSEKTYRKFEFAL